ncbi:type I glutamate--ammonia ligase [Thermococcus sp.]|uniref:type I glutamate--ammonia ligase n=1 Tax=Thermococcus sp. TaxID=35749 RepID=UPI00261024EB|nr:type I glutamate--ammonia ligase [Thermococcus sp.]
MNDGAVERARRMLSRGGIRQVLCAFTDVRGYLLTFSIPAREFIEGSVFEEGIGFDGSSVRGFGSIERSDMVWKPDPTTLRIIPWTEGIHASAIMFGDVYEAGGSERADSDPRGFVARRMEEKLKGSGRSAVFGPEIEFFVFDGVDIRNLVWDPFVTPNGGEGDSWGAPRVLPRSGEIYELPIIRPKEGYFRAPPEDRTLEYRNELVYYLERMGIIVEYHHHEVATAGQVELDFKPLGLVDVGDAFYIYKFAAKNVARKRGLLATFMPKPIYMDNASGMHTHQSLWDGRPFGGTNLFADPDDEYGLSQLGRYYVGGLLEHAPALTALNAPTVNSYKRLVPGFEAPIYIAWSPSNRSALVRVPAYFRKPSAIRIEYRGADPSQNPYLGISAQLAAGLDGIRRKIDPGDPVMKDIYRLSERERRELGIGELPTSLKEALEYLASDEVIQRVLGSHVYDAFMELKTDEWNQYSLYITPWEFMKYFDV